MAVAFWLAADGGTDDGLFENVNPVCRRDPDPALADCDLEVTALGTWAATRIFLRILMAVYADSSSDWHDFAEYAKQSAVDICGAPFPNCDNAADEQDTVQDAFTAIGYPGPTPLVRYCNPDCCPN